MRTAAEDELITVCAGSWDAIEIDRVGVRIGGEGPGLSSITSGAGPAFTLSSEALSLTGFTLTGVADTGEGAGVHAVDAELVLSDLVIAGCADDGGSARAVVAERSVVEIDGVVFEDNAVSSYLLQILDGSDAVVRHCIFRNNRAGSGSETGLLQAHSSDAEISNHLFYGNVVNGYSAVNLFPADSFVWTYNNTWYDNQTTTALTYLIQLYEGADFQNNIVVANSGHGVFVHDGPSAATLEYNDSWGNDGDEFQVFGGEPSPTNFESDPRFVDADAGDLTLEPGFSPCIDASNALASQDDPDGSRGDLGAYGGPHAVWP